MVLLMSLLSRSRLCAATALLWRTIKNDDSVIFFNFRPDRARQLTQGAGDSGFQRVSG